MNNWFFDVREKEGQIFVAFVKKNYWNQCQSLAQNTISHQLEDDLPPNLSIDVFDEVKPSVFISYLDEHQTREGLKLAGFSENKLFNNIKENK